MGKARKAKPPSKKSVAAKTKTPPKPTRAAASNAASTTSPARVELATVLGLLGQVPALSDVQRAAFRSRFSDAQCLVMGGQTKAPVVLREATGWAKLVHATLKTLGSVGAYSLARFAWMLECARDLALALEAQDGRARSARGAKSADENAQRAALAARETLEEKLSMLAGGDAEERRALQGALGTTENASAIAESIGKLAELAQAWLDRDDPSSKALVASVNLSQGDVDTAQQAAAALEVAASGAVGEKLIVRDSPAVNLVEGRLLYEMKAVRGVFERARERNPAVPRLPLGAATRHVLGPRKAGAAAPDDPPPSPEPAAAPSAARPVPEPAG